MKEMIRYGLILAIVCTVAAGLLASVNLLTKARIIAQAQAEQDASLKEVMPAGENFQPFKSGEEIIYYQVYDKNKTYIGIAFKSQGKGYSSTIETMVGLNKDGTINAIKILSQNETPGLGAQVVEPAFTGQFKNKNSEKLDEVQAITGATISSKAVIEAVKTKIQELKTVLKDGQ